MSEKTNDIFERIKTFVLTQKTFIFDGKQLERNRFERFDRKISAELSKYRQVSFAYDYEEGLSGYASPMMWGQYAWTKDKNNNWQSGVCLAIDSEKIKLPTSKVFSHKILYKSTIESPFVENIDYTQENAAAFFVERNVETYFFTKHIHWKYENEYRFVSKEEGEIDISDAITGIYILWSDESPLDIIKTVVNQPNLINLLSLSNFKHSENNPYTLKEIDDLQELMKTYKF
ncbi:MAG: DUF2971 domain-containing protein [Paludibacteraceae bacterium]|nr:DUF2971 domain-containing protein [Paludibacteraceae bacterium]